MVQDACFFEIPKVKNLHASLWLWQAVLNLNNLFSILTSAQKGLMQEHAAASHMRTETYCVKRSVFTRMVVTAIVNSC